MRELEELSDTFRLLRADIMQQRRPIEEFQKSGSSLGETSMYSKRASLVQDRYQRVERLVADRLDNLIEQLTSARNLKENFELTNSWLNEIDQIYLGNEKVINGHSNKRKPCVVWRRRDCTAYQMFSLSRL